MRTLHQLGFTLIELLVVIVILGITVTFVVLNVDLKSQSKAVEQTAKELLYLIESAHQQALLQAQPIGLTIQNDGYSFWQFTLSDEQDTGTWQALSHDKLLSLRRIPAGIHIDLRMLAGTEGIKVSATEQPKLIFLSDGTQLPFKIFISAERSLTKYCITGLANGDFSLDKL